MKIVVLNECFLNADHLKRLKKLGEVVIYNDTDTEEKVIARLQDADIAVADGFVAPLNKKTIGSVNRLKFLALAHTSFAVADVQTAKEKGVKVSNVPGYSTQAVAEMAIGLLFAVNRKIALMDRLMRKDPFELDPGKKENQKYFGFDLKNKTLGVIGLGAIGGKVAELARGLGMEVNAYNRTPKNVLGVALVDLSDLLRVSDVVVVTLALNKETENFISTKQFGLMKPGAIFINVCGAVVDSTALVCALQEQKIAGAGLDSVPGMRKDHPILKLDNVVLTGAHAGAFTSESFLENLPSIIVQNIEAFVKGAPVNLVN